LFWGKEALIGRGATSLGSPGCSELKMIDGHVVRGHSLDSGEAVISRCKPCPNGVGSQSGATLLGSSYSVLLGKLPFRQKQESGAEPALGKLDCLETGTRDHSPVARLCHSSLGLTPRSGP
jgi:hypothetical protein